jgi:hypothetical protein
MIDEEWAPLRAAVPSFADRWAQLVARSDYHPADYGNRLEFVSHLEELLDSSGLDALLPLAAALEPLYERAALGIPDARTAEELDNLLTISLQEDVAHALEERGLDLRAWASHFAGPRTLDGWRRALAWTHPECEWDDVKGLVRSEPLAPRRGTFRPSSVRPGADGASLEMRGHLEPGVARVGWFVRRRLSSGHHATLEITALRQEVDGNGMITLVVRYEWDDLETAALTWDPEESERYDLVESLAGTRHVSDS